MQILLDNEVESFPPKPWTELTNEDKRNAVDVHFVEYVSDEVCPHFVRKVDRTRIKCKKYHGYKKFTSPDRLEKYMFEHCYNDHCEKSNKKRSIYY